MPTWFTQLPQWIQAIIVFLGSLSAICTALSGLFALFGWKKGVAACAAIGADIMKLLALLQGFLPANKPIEQVAQKEVKAQAMKNTLKVGLFAVVALFATVGCQGSLQKDLNTALVFEGQAQSAEQTIVLVAQQAIALLPADKQGAAQATLADASNKATLAFAAKDAALQAAIDADSSSGLNLAQLLSDVTAAIQAIVELANSFGADQALTAKLGALAVRAK